MAEMSPTGPDVPNGILGLFLSTAIGRTGEVGHTYPCCWPKNMLSGHWSALPKHTYTGARWEGLRLILGRAMRSPSLCYVPL